MNFVRMLVLNYIKKIEKSLEKTKFYQNINKDFTIDNQKRVLISYITNCVEIVSFEEIRHTNVLECNAIIRVFQNMGYTIDLIQSSDRYHISEMKKNKYDIIFGFGIPFQQASKINRQALKIIYLTESSTDYMIEKQKERLEYYFKRNNRNSKIGIKSGFFYNRNVREADFGILIGNEFTLKSYDPDLREKIYTLCPTGLINKNFDNKNRDIFKSKNKFLWFGSTNAVLKGLDILIDVFKDIPDADLYICGLSCKEEKEILSFSKGASNIVNKGFINYSSKEFNTLMEECSWCILPSASEGMATAVLTCMNHGMIPVVTREAGIENIDYIGIVLEKYNVEYIKSKIRELILYDVNDIKKMHSNVFCYSRKKFNLGRFKEDFRIILEKIIRKFKIISEG